MKTKECARIRKSLRKYLDGHIFKLEQIRIERHLKSCQVCSSEYQALKQADETKQILRDIAPSEGMTGIVKETLFGVTKLRKLLYRPLWVIGIAGAVALLYVNFFTSKRDLEIENIEKSLPPAAAGLSLPTVTSGTFSQSTPSPFVAVQTFPSQRTAMPEAEVAPEPFIITIIPDNENNGIARINQSVRAASLNGQFGESTREIAGSLQAGDLLRVLSSIEASGKVIYSRKRLEAVAKGKTIPFVIKLKATPARAVQTSLPTADMQRGAPVSTPTGSAGE